MKTTDIKIQMMKLWKETFHDSDEYISLIFDNYFDPKFIEVATDNNKVVAAMMGIPYNFNCGSIEYSNNNNLRGLYLCGLATDPLYRGRGLMIKMIDRINQRALNLNFDFTFLIPADEGLNKYYYDRGFVNFSYIKTLRFSNYHNFINDYNSRIKCNEQMNTRRLGYEKENKNIIISDDNILNILNVSDTNECNMLAEWLIQHDKLSHGINIIHSIKDWHNVFKENSISGGMMVYIKNESNEFKAVAFIDSPERENNSCTVSVRDIVSVDTVSKYYLMQYISILLSYTLNYNLNNFNSLTNINSDKLKSPVNIGNNNEESFISINSQVESRSPSELEGIYRDVLNILNTPSRCSLIPSSFFDSFNSFFIEMKVDGDDSTWNNSAIWEPYYSGSLEENEDASIVRRSEMPANSALNLSPYTMIKILKWDNILKFVEGYSESINERILIEKLYDNNAMQIGTSNGKYIINFTNKQCNDNNNYNLNESGEIEISSKNLSEILFRRPDEAIVVTLSLGIPRIPVKIDLMLD